MCSLYPTAEQVSLGVQIERAARMELIDRVDKVRREQPKVYEAFSSQLAKIVSRVKTEYSTDICLISLAADNHSFLLVQDGCCLPEQYAHPSHGFSFCQQTLCRPIPVIVEDLLEHPLREHPLVSGPPHLRFYVGAPIEYKPDFNVGALCMFSDAPRPNFGLNHCTKLQALAEEIVPAIRQLIGDWEDPSSASTVVMDDSDAADFHW